METTVHARQGKHASFISGEWLLYSGPASVLLISLMKLLALVSGISWSAREYDEPLALPGMALKIQ